MANEANREFDFELTGVMPIVMHKDDVEWADRLKAWQKDPRNKKISVPGDDRSPPWTWIGYLHHDGTHVAIPGEVIMAAIRVAAAKMTMRRQESFKSTSQSGMMVDAEFCEFTNAGECVRMSDILPLDGDGIAFAEQSRRVNDLGFRLWVKRLPNPGSQAKNVRVRPRFDDWTVRGRILVMEPVITDDVLNTMFEIAGRQCGLLEHRPSAKKCPGPYGRFEHTLIPVGRRKVGANSRAGAAKAH